MPSYAKRIVKHPLTGKYQVLDPLKRKKVPCVICKKPMLVAQGEKAKYHGKANGNCRKLRHNKSNKK